MNDETHWMALVVEILAVVAAVVFAVWQSA